MTNEEVNHYYKVHCEAYKKLRAEFDKRIKDAGCPFAYSTPNNLPVSTVQSIYTKKRIPSIETLVDLLLINDSRR